MVSYHWHYNLCSPRGEIDVASMIFQLYFGCISTMGLKNYELQIKIILKSYHPSECPGTKIIIL